MRRTTPFGDKSNWFFGNESAVLATQSLLSAFPSISAIYSTSVCMKYTLILNCSNFLLDSSDFSILSESFEWIPNLYHKAKHENEDVRCFIYIPQSMEDHVNMLINLSIWVTLEHECIEKLVGVGYYKAINTPKDAKIQTQVFNRCYFSFYDLKRTI